MNRYGKITEQSIQKKESMFQTTRKYKQILQENHELADVEYPGQQRMLELIKRNFWWLGIRNNIKKYVQIYIKY